MPHPLKPPLRRQASAWMTVWRAGLFQTGKVITDCVTDLIFAFSVPRERNCLSVDRLISRPFCDHLCATSRHCNSTPTPAVLDLSTIIFTRTILVVLGRGFWPRSCIGFNRDCRDAEKRGMIQNAFSQIGYLCNLERGATTCIPNLVETAQGHTFEHERETLEAVINARNQVDGRACRPRPPILPMATPFASWRGGGMHIVEGRARTGRRRQCQSWNAPTLRISRPTRT